ncbi:NAD(P)-dependent oxidoreductase [bacterium]|nr:NAD(P)-dependent oxidoreductase [bacterium]MCG2675995.1 NAD(P)-dependent oxidoreductase [bacterium]
MSNKTATTLLPEERKKSFREIHRCYEPHQAYLEASRCLMCEDAPCTKECPAGVDIKKFIRKIRFHNLRGAIREIRKANVLAGICGRVCPQELLCQKECSNTEIDIPINITALQRYVADVDFKKGPRPLPGVSSKGIKVAIVGSGPASLAVAANLAQKGYEVSIFEAEAKPGGLLTYGIPPHRLPPSATQKEIRYIKKMGVNIKCNTKITDIDELFKKDFKAIFIGVGLPGARKIGLPGENLKGVYTALEFLKDVIENKCKTKKTKIGKRVVVIGGGDVAMDAASCALRLGAQRVDLVCLEGYDEMPSSPEERRISWEEGVEIHTRVMPLRIIGSKGRVTGYKGIGIRWRKPGLFIPSNAIPIPGTEFSLKVDTVIEAIGQMPDTGNVKGFKRIETAGSGYIVAKKKTFKTSCPGVFAAGDIVNRGATVVQAVADGNAAAEAIDAYLKRKSKHRVTSNQ